MKRITSAIVFSIINLLSFAQTPTLFFDGIDDYIDLGLQAGAGIRTLECWFKLTNEVNSNQSTFSSIVVRNTPNEFEEIFLCFYPTGIMPNLPGHLVFGINLQSATDRIVYSDSNHWEANRWYHVAGVIDPINGMSLYIDGLKQQSTEPNTAPSEISTFTTTIGSWGDAPNRNFSGYLEDLRFSSVAIYSGNFTPPCPNLEADSHTIGLWNFNEASGTIAVDSSSNSYNGTIYGSTYSTDMICKLNNVNRVKSSISDFKIYPNPSKGSFNFQNLNSEAESYQIDIYNSIGQQIIREYSNSSKCIINIENYDNGVYYYLISDKEVNYKSGKLFKID